MTKAEQRALEAYPRDMQQLIKFDHSTEFVDANNRDRAIYRKGYEQAEKDQQGQPSEDLEKEITPSLVENMLYEFGVQSIDDLDSENLAKFARHFYELGLNARKEDKK